jgi:cytochrome b involved in lipid metabolism
MTATTTLTQEKKTVKAAPAAKAGEGNGTGLLARFVPKAGAGAGKLVSAAELAENCGIGSSSGRAWVALHGHVFDITEFSKTHPGGKSIRLAAGRSEDMRACVCAIRWAILLAVAYVYC